MRSGTLPDRASGDHCIVCFLTTPILQLPPFLLLHSCSLPQEFPRISMTPRFWLPHSLLSLPESTARSVTEKNLQKMDSRLCPSPRGSTAASICLRSTHYSSTVYLHLPPLGLITTRLLACLPALLGPAPLILNLSAYGWGGE